jgi:hypothetical protein
MMENRRNLKLAWLAVAALGVGAATAWLVVRPDRQDEIDADAGQLTEITYRRPDDVPRLDLADSTSRWNLSRSVEIGASIGPSQGGLAMSDLDVDGDLDLVVAHGSLEVRVWDGAAFGDPVLLPIDDAVAVDVADVDGDSWPDLLVARSGPADAIIWGGDWAVNAAHPEMTELEGSQPSAGLQAAELSGDGRTDIIRLGRGAAHGEPDVLWIADDAIARSFSRTNLSSDRRLSLSAEIFDADMDGLNDVWVTRDVGWAEGPDSVYSRRGDPKGEFIDVAESLGADLAIDGMGITVADLDGDALLDAYLSDLGDNEVLIRSGDGYIATTDTGAARIRAPGASEKFVSSSWASGAADFNLDGRLDLVVVNGGFASGRMRNKVGGTDVSVTDPPSILLGLGNGRFADGWAELEFDWNTSGRGLTIADIDADGDDDLVILSEDGTLRAFENQSTAPSVSVSVSGPCDLTGATVTVINNDRVFHSLLKRHTYNGAHASELSVGVTGLQVDLEVSVRWPDGRIAIPLLVAEKDGRKRHVAECPARSTTPL